MSDRARIFGFRVSPLDAAAIAHRIATELRPLDRGVGLVVTANIDHVHRLRRDAALRAAYDAAEIVTCDGFPVYRYAKLRGAPAPARVTGCEIAKLLMQPGALAASHRPFLVVDCEQTAREVAAWAGRNHLDVATAVPDYGFETDPEACKNLADAIAAHGTTLLMMGVGAPKSEIFVQNQRARLPACWAVCIGQAIRIETGLTQRAPGLVLALNLEWLWRLAHEPRRLARRYVTASFGFMAAVVEDVAGERKAATGKARGFAPRPQ